nr:calcium-binding protein [Sinorhizobium mexicanum]
MIIDLSTTSDRLEFNGQSGHGIIGYRSANERHIFFHDTEWLRLTAGSGNDRIKGTAGSDTISTGAGDDVVEGGTGQDTITNTGGHDRLDGGEGNDRFILVETGSTVFGGSGDDRLTIDLSAVSDQVVFNGENGHGILGYRTIDERHLFVRHYDVEEIVLTTGSGNDRIQGTVLRDVIQTQAGNDFVDAGAGDDMIVDGRGANRLFGGAGNDGITTTLYSAEVDGGLGEDWVRIEERVRLSDATIDFSIGRASTGTIFRGIESASVGLGSGNDTVIGGNLDYVIVDAGAGDDRVEGSTGGDRLNGEGGNDHIDGGEGNDTLSTGVGDDVAFGGDGKDFLDGGTQDDLLSGGNGADILVGGGGADTFLWSTESPDQQGIDRIRDFETGGGDVIAFSDIAEQNTGIRNYADFLAASTDTASGVYVAFNGSDTYGLLIEGVSLQALTAGDVIFGVV